ncbi:MAG: hypothetical protein HYV67_04695 [Candidatus Taylorbacteria bacterium]|nr:hypothetical protein [Candidatus Taylorbacteria bacterium]
MKKKLLEKTLPTYRMATTAHHISGDISRDQPSLCIIREENREWFIGSWVFGLGFFGVRFPKRTTRKLTPEEIKMYDGMYVTLQPHPIKIT